jgi:hypothetical protein
MCAAHAHTRLFIESAVSSGLLDTVVHDARTAENGRCVTKDEEEEEESKEGKRRNRCA